MTLKFEELRVLQAADQMQNYTSQLSDLARQLNAFTSCLESQRRGRKSRPKTVSETPANNGEDQSNDPPVPLFTENELPWLQKNPKI